MSTPLRKRTDTESYLLGSTYATCQQKLFARAQLYRVAKLSPLRFVVYVIKRVVLIVNSNTFYKIQPPIKIQLKITT